MTPEDTKRLERITTKEFLDKPKKYLNLTGGEHQIEVIGEDGKVHMVLGKGPKLFEDPKEKTMDEIRDCLKRFAVACESELKRNDHKGGWENDTPEALVRRLLEETGELVEAVAEWRKGSLSSAEVRREAADVGNFAMMVFDKFPEKTK